MRMGIYPAWYILMWRMRLENQLWRIAITVFRISLNLPAHIDSAQMMI